jgi:hypothetical protein
MPEDVGTNPEDNVNTDVSEKVAVAEKGAVVELEGSARGFQNKGTAN